MCVLAMAALSLRLHGNFSYTLHLLLTESSLTGIRSPGLDSSAQLVDQLFIDYSEVMENNVYRTLSLEMLDHANIWTATRCLFGHGNEHLDTDSTKPSTNCKYCFSMLIPCLPQWRITYKLLPTSL